MLYIAKPRNFPYTSSAVNMWIMNQFHTHSQKKQNPAKKFIKFGQIKIARQRRRWDWRRDRAARCCDRRAAWFYDRQSVRCCDQRLARRDRWIGARFMVIGEVASSSLFAISLSLSPEILWSENENWIHFPPQKPYFTVKLKIFLVWPNLPDLPNILFSGKGFLNSIWSQNKWTLSPYPITSHVNIISIYKKCL